MIAKFLLDKEIAAMSGKKLTTLLKKGFGQLLDRPKMKQSSSSYLAVTSEIVQLPQDFEENEAAATSIGARICFVTMALEAADYLFKKQS